MLEQFEIKYLEEKAQLCMCPINTGLMEDPVYYLVNDKKQRFSREAIKTWLLKNNTCPNTRQNIITVDLITDEEMQDLISRMKAKNFFNAEVNDLKPMEELDITQIRRFLHEQRVRAIKNQNTEEMRALRLNVENQGRLAILSNPPENNAYYDLQNSDLSDTILNVDLGMVKLRDANLTNADLTDATLNKEELLGAGSLVGITLDAKTLVEKNQYSDEDLVKLKQKIVADYLKVFKSHNDTTQPENLTPEAASEQFKSLLKLLLNIQHDPQHPLKLRRSYLGDTYGNTESYARVINEGRRRLSQLSQHFDLPLQLAEPHLQQALENVFRTNVYPIHRRLLFLGCLTAADNAEESLERMLAGNTPEPADKYFYYTKY